MADGPVEEPWALPEGWRWERLGDVCLEPDRGAPSSRFTQTFRYTDVGGVGEGIEAKQIDSTQAPSRARQFVREGDTLLSGVRVNLRRTLFVDRPFTDVASTAFCVLTPAHQLHPKFNYYWCVSDELVRRLVPLQKGNQPPAVSEQDIRAQPIPLPPLDVQHRIVARIDELLADLDDGEALLARARDDLTTWRRALLKAAVTGELTADWRTANPPAETGADLLARILDERRARRSTVNARGPKILTESVTIEATMLSGVPKHWGVTSADVILKWASGKFLPDRLMVKGSIPVYGGNGVTGDHDVPMVDSPTLVIGRVGFYCGNSTVTEGPAWITDNAIYAREIHQHVDPEFIQICFEASNLRANAQGGAQPFISQSLLNSIRLPLPSYSEQLQIVEIFNGAKSAMLDMTASIQDARNDSSLLQQSILSAAFRGDLTA